MPPLPTRRTRRYRPPIRVCGSATYSYYPAAEGSFISAMSWQADAYRYTCIAGDPLRWTAPIFAGKASSMSNAIIKQQGDSPIVADNIWEFRLGGGSFLLGALAGALVTAAVGRHIAKDDAAPKPPTPRGWPINFAHRGGAKVVPENTIEGFREGFARGGGVVECDVHASAEGTMGRHSRRGG
jgi:hypothetical protein